MSEDFSFKLKYSKGKHVKQSNAGMKVAWFVSLFVANNGQQKPYIGLEARMK
jgi:hypothetical protein